MAAEHFFDELFTLFDVWNFIVDWAPQAKEKWAYGNPTDQIYAVRTLFSPL